MPRIVNSLDLQDTYHDLDSLAGTWSHQEANEFLKDINDFEQIDEMLWIF